MSQHEKDDLADDVELGVVASMDLDELTPKIKRLAEAVKLLHSITNDLVDRLPDNEATEYMDDLAEVADLLRFGP